MSLEGAKIICLNDGALDQNEVISAQGRTFKFGYYMDCDIVLEHPEAMGVQCTIDCDAFGRVTIENRCPDQTVTLNGNILKKMRPLLHNTEICILDKKFLWQFEGNLKSGGFQMEDVGNFTTPCKQMAKAQQPPNSEPARRWRTQFQKRLTIHSFAYCIKANESPKDVEITPDENKPLNTYERIIPVDSEAPASFKSLPLSPPPIAADLIDLKTPTARQRPLAGQRTPLSCCKLSETVITSYSPRETGVRPEKSFAVVQSPVRLSAKSAVFPDVSLGTFQQLPSPLTQSHRPSMHLIDLTTPKKRLPPFSPAKTLLKSTLKKNIPSTSVKPQQHRSISETTATSMESVYSVPSTDGESVIELSDEGGFSPSPVPKTPQRKTPQSLMKHAIISSAKKATTTKRLLVAAKQTPSRLMLTPPGTSGVRFQSQSTPQRKSLGRLQSPSDSHKSSHSVAGKAAKSMFTSTPFRVGETAASKRSILRTPSTSLTGVKNKSRTSLMLKHALSKSPQTSSAKKRKSVSFIEATKSPAIRARKSVSFLDRIESEDNQSLNQTFSIEEKEELPKKDATFSPQKEKFPSSQGSNVLKEVCPTIPTIVITDEKETDKNSKTAVIGPSDTVVSHPTDITNEHAASGSQTPQSSRNHSKEANTSLAMRGLAPTVKLLPNMDVMEDDDFEGLDAIFKTPKAKNLMILGSPKSISLQKPTTDSVELVHSTEFDLSANLDDIFKTPQSEFITNRVEGESTPANVENMEPYSPEEAFDLLVGRPITRKTYANKTTPPKQEMPPMNVDRDNSLPKTDIEEWIDNVHDSIHLFGEDDDNEDEMSYLTATQNEFSRDPLMTSSITGSVSTTNRKKRDVSLKDESAMTIQEDVENEELDVSALKDPLEMTAMASPKKPVSPNISGIDLLDHTSESLFSETLAVSDESSGKESDKTIGQVDDDRGDGGVSHADRDINISPDKARREMEEAFKNFEKERKMLEGKRLVSTPEPTKPVSRVYRRKTMGSQQTLHAYFDVKLMKEQRDREIAFENFKEEPNTVGPRLCMTPEVNKTARNEMRKTMGNPVEGASDIKAIKAERDIKLAFENLNEEPGYAKAIAVQTPEPGKLPLKHHRRTMGSELVAKATPDLKALQAEFETELAFENFEETPQFSEKRSAHTPESKKAPLTDHRRTLGSNLLSEVALDLKAAKAQLEMNLSFENFEDEPEISKKRAAQTPEPKKPAFKDHRRTMGSNLVAEVTLDLKAAKAQLEMEQAFKNFDEEPKFSEERAAQTPEPKKPTLEDHRRTMGSNLLSEVTLDLEAAKAQLEMEQAFENFDEEPEFSEERAARTPEPKKRTLKDHRKTMGSNLLSEVTLDLQAAKTRLEMEQAFENFDEEPEFSEERAAQTPEPKKPTLKDHRRTMGSNLLSEVTLDLEAAKAQLEIEQAFENFDEEPEFSEERAAQTPEPKKPTLKDHRRTMGSNLLSEVTLDLQAAKTRLEIEQAFENFDEEPEFSEERAAQTPEPKKPTLKDHRRTMGSNLLSEVTLDLEAAKAQLEIEQAFENFDEEPEFSEERAAQTPEPKKPTLKDHRRTMGSNLLSEVTLDLEAAKAQLEIEQAFENFDEEPEFSGERAARTPEPKKPTLKDHRRTVGSNLLSEVTLDLEAAKAQLEIEQAFENFDEEPEFSGERAARTPEPKKPTLKDHRKTMGSNLLSEVTLDLEAAKAQLEIEQAFENFDEEPEFSEERAAQTPEPKKPTLKDHRRTMGSNLLSEVTLDLEAAKAQLEIEQAFENFDEEPEFSEERAAQTPEPKKPTLKDHRRTMGSNLLSEVTLDLEAAKAQLEIEQAFENFDEEPEFSGERAARTPEPKKPTLKDHRRTVGSNLLSEVTLDLQAAKTQLEMDQAFENFDEEPEFFEERAAQTPEPKKPTLKDHRRTMGSNLLSEVTLDLEAAKAQLEIEQAFENFDEEPQFSEARAARTPEPKKSSLKDHRRTVGSNLLSEVTLDLQAAKTRLEIEQAFENFDEEPEFSGERTARTPEPKKPTLKDHRKTMGSNLLSEVTLDLEAAKAQLEIEQAFENFDEEPEFSEARAARTPEPKKRTLKDHRKTMGSNLLSEVTLDLQAAKTRLEMEQAFENFDEEPEFSEERAAQTPEPKKPTLKDHRRTMGSNLLSEVTLDLEAAKAQLEIEQAFENFDEEPEFSKERAAQTPERKKPAKSLRMSLGHRNQMDNSFDLNALKSLQKENEVAALEPSIRKVNDGLQPVMEINDDDDASETKNTVAVSDSNDPKSKAVDDQLRSEGLRKDPITVTETEVKLTRKRQELMDGEHKCQKEVFSQTSIDEHLSIQPRTRRRRQNTIDEIHETKSNSTTEIDNIATTVPSQPKPRRRRQPTIDDVEQLKQQEQGSTCVNFKTVEMQSSRKRGRQNSVDVGFNIKDEDNHCLHKKEALPQNQPDVEEDVPLKSDEEEILRTKSTSEDDSSEAHSIIPLSKKMNEDSKVYNPLEAIAEEEKLVAAQLDAAKSKTKPIGRRAGRNQDARENPTPKSVLNLNAEADEISSTPNKSSINRIRGRTAQLSVVLLDSKKNSSPSLHSEHLDEVKMKADQELEPTAARNDADEVIPCTPVPTRTRGRRPAHKVESAETVAPALRRGRRGSVQQDVDVKVDKGYVEQMILTTPVPTKLPGHEALLEMESTDGNSSTAVDLIPPTPEPAKPRGRRAAYKEDSSKSTSENLTPSRNRSRQKEDKIHTDQATVAPGESVNEGEDQRKSIHNIEVDIDTATVVPTIPLIVVKAAPVRKGSRRKAEADAEVSTEESDIAPTGSAAEGRDQLRFVGDADTHINEAPVKQAPVRRRGRKKAVEDQSDLPPTEPLAENIKSQLKQDRGRGDVEKSEAHPNKIAVTPTEPTVKEKNKRKSVENTGADTSATAVPSNENSAPPRKRGRRRIIADPDGLTVEVAPALKTESAADIGELVDSADITSAQASKRGRKRAVHDPNTSTEALPVVATEHVPESLPKTRRTGRRGDVDHPSKLNIETITPSGGTSKPLESTTKDSVPVEGIQANAEEDVSSNVTTKKRGRKPKLDVSVPKTLTPIVCQSTQVALKTRGRRVAIKSESVDTDAESSTPAQKSGREGAIGRAQISAIEIKEEVAVQQDQTDSEEVVPSTPVQSKPRGRRAALKAEPIRPASVTPVRGRGRRGAEVVAKELVVEVKIEPTTESANPSRRRGRKGADKKSPTKEIVDQKVIVESEVITEDDDVEKAIRSTSESPELLAENGPNDNKIPAAEQAVLSKAGGLVAVVISEPTPESSTPVRKRGRKAVAKKELHPTETAEASAKDSPADNLDLEEPPSSKSDPPRTRRLPAKLLESAPESITPRQRRVRKPINKQEEESTDFDRTPVKPEIKSNSRPIRTRRASAKDVSEEEPLASPEAKLPPVAEEFIDKSQKKLTRGRKAQPKKDAPIDSIKSQTEEEHPPSPIETKTTRGRKQTVKADTLSTKEKPQSEDTKNKRARKANPVEAKTSSEEEVEAKPEPTKKTTRSKTTAQLESVNSEPEVIQATKKTTRGRKVAARDSDDEHSSQSGTPKNSTRSRKAPQPPVTKRANKRNVEIIAEADQEDTPSKRIRRKPNILLSDEFVH